MTQNSGTRIAENQTLEERLQRVLLCRGSGIGRVPVLVQSALIANSDGMGIVVAGMGTNLVLRTAGIDNPVLGDVEVIAYSGETASSVACFQIFYREVPGNAGGTAMYHNQ